MAYKHANLEELFIGIADAIREKTGTNDDICADDFPDAIANISTGGNSGGANFAFGQIIPDETLLEVSGLSFRPSNYIVFNMTPYDDHNTMAYSTYFSDTDTSSRKWYTPIIQVYNIEGQCNIALISPSVDYNEEIASTAVYSGADINYFEGSELEIDEGTTSDGFYIDVSNNFSGYVYLAGVNYSLTTYLSFEGSTWGYICWS